MTIGRAGLPSLSATPRYCDPGNQPISTRDSIASGLVHHRITSPSATGSSPATLPPFTVSPFLPRLATHHRPSANLNLACSRDTVGSGGSRRSTAPRPATAAGLDQAQHRYRRVRSFEHGHVCGGGYGGCLLRNRARPPVMCHEFWIAVRIVAAGTARRQRRAGEVWPAVLRRPRVPDTDTNRPEAEHRGDAEHRQEDQDRGSDR